MVIKRFVHKDIFMYRGPAQHKDFMARAVCKNLCYGLPDS